MSKRRNRAQCPDGVGILGLCFDLLRWSHPRRASKQAAEYMGWGLENCSFPHQQVVMEAPGTGSPVCQHSVAPWRRGCLQEAEKEQPEMEEDTE